MSAVPDRTARTGGRVPRHRGVIEGFYGTPYPRDRLREFEELATLGAGLGVRIVAAVAPGPSWREGDPGDARLLEAKLRSLHACGIGGLAVLFDDLVDATVDAVEPEIQARIAGRAWNLTQALRPSPEIWIRERGRWGELDRSGLGHSCPN